MFKVGDKVKFILGNDSLVPSWLAGNVGKIIAIAHRERYKYDIEFTNPELNRYECWSFTDKEFISANSYIIKERLNVK